MIQLAANVSMMFTEREFLDRFAAAASCGFTGAEYLFPYDFPAEEVAKALADAKLHNALFNFPPGNWDAGERGLAGLPGRETEFAESLALGLHYAEVIGCKQLHLMYGLPPDGADRAECERLYISNLKRAAEAARAIGLTILIEPLNTRDVPGYPLLSQAQAHDIVSKVGADNVSVQFDLYHCQIMEGDVATKIKAFAGRFGHVQIAGVPERHEPDIGEVNYAYLLDTLDASGYRGWVGCEYRPQGRTEAGLGWAAGYGINA
ncbi:MAG: 2-oxo-tetronate isomerase [Pseudomonadota bacterium]